MLKCPRPLKRLYQFQQQDGKRFIADLVRCQVLEIDALTWQVLERCPSLDNEAIIKELSPHYPVEEIRSVFEHLSTLEAARLLFHPESAPESIRATDRPTYLCPNSDTFLPNIRGLAGGHSIALHYLIQAVGASYADVHICRSTEEVLADGVYGVPFHPEGPAFLGHLLQEKYQGLLLHSTADTAAIPLLQFLPIPVVIPLYAVRGQGGDRINQVFLWYSTFRDYDAFIVPSESVKNFYDRFCLDTTCFYVSPYGVDHELFHPMDKALAKRQVAEMLEDNRILEKPIVGFLSRLQPEKGGGTYLQIARLLPDALFLAVAPTLEFYAHAPLPDNFIYAGAQPREKLPLFFNAFDLHCFPSVVGEETFGMVVLEAMACGTPPVASHFDGIPEVVGDAGVLVPAETYVGEMGSIAGYVSAEKMAEAIRGLLDNPEKRRSLGEMAHKRALNFTWEKAARDLVEFFDELNRRRAHPMPQIPDTAIFFTPFLHENDGRLDYQSILAGTTHDRRILLQFDSYIQSVEEGLALALLKHHTWHEVEALLHQFCGREETKGVLRRVRQFLETLSV